MENKKNCKTVTISSFLEWVRESHEVKISNHNVSFFQNHVYYRGHASTSWELIPSLMRDKGRIHDEHKMLLLASNMLWTEFNDCNTALEKMVRLQHYGLHTRLLDITYNPLAALFFACQTSSNSIDKEDGIVLCGYLEEAKKSISMAIADYVFNYDTINIDYKALTEICNHYDVRIESLESIHLISPPLNNPRITAQNGAFIMTPLLKSDAEKPFQHANYEWIKKQLENAFTNKFVIPADYKPMILDELDYLGFNNATIFTDISNKLKYINEKENKDWPCIDLS